MSLPSSTVNSSTLSLNTTPVTTSPPHNHISVDQQLRGRTQDRTTPSVRKHAQPSFSAYTRRYVPKPDIDISSYNSSSDFELEANYSDDASMFVAPIRLKSHESHLREGSRSHATPSEDNSSAEESTAKAVAPSEIREDSSTRSNSPPPPEFLEPSGTLSMKCRYGDECALNGVVVQGMKGFREHLKAAHSVSGSSESEEAQRCNNCKTFNGKGLMRHILMHHADGVKLKCRQCPPGKGFYSYRPSLMRHIRKSANSVKNPHFMWPTGSGVVYGYEARKA